ncbi:CBS domain-containing protein, partial [Acidianus sp. RZ1]|nr:CBS domain-containing protein [Acidianus sp. RZ1]
MVSKVRFLITKNPLTIDKRATIKQAVDIMSSNNVGSLAIMEDGKLKG